MGLSDFLHEQYESDGDLVLFRCSECGHVSMSLGSLHAHVTEHWSYWTWLWWHTLGGLRSGRNKWMEGTEVHRVTDTESISLEEVEGL